MIFFSYKKAFNTIIFSQFFSSLFFMGVFLFCVNFLFFSSSVFADDGRLPTAWKTHVEKIDGIQDPLSGSSTEIINTLLVKNIVPLVKYVFIGVALIFFGIYSYSLSIGMGAEDQFTEQRKNFLFAVIGFTVIGLSAKVVELVNPVRSGNSQVINIDQTESVVKTVITYLEMGLGTIAIVVIFYGALQMIISDGDEEKSSIGKNILKYGFIGLSAVMLAEVLVTKIFYTKTAIEGGGIGNQEATELIIQGIGILEFTLQFLAIGVFLSFLISGFLYLTAGADDDQSEKAKKTLIWTAVGTIVVVVSYGILTFFTPA